MKAIIECPTCHSHKVAVDHETDMEVCVLCGETGFFPLFLVENSTYATIMDELKSTKGFYTDGNI